jgi:hypothetical protein
MSQRRLPVRWHTAVAERRPVPKLVRLARFGLAGVLVGLGRRQVYRLLIAA